MVRAAGAGGQATGEGKGLSLSFPRGGADTFATIAKAYKRQGKAHLTLHLCEAFEERTGQPLVPSTLQGLVLLLEAMEPKTAWYARRPGSSSSSSGSSSQRWGDGAGGGGEKVKELLRRFEEGGKVGWARLGSGIFMSEGDSVNDFYGLTSTPKSNERLSSVCRRQLPYAVCCTIPHLFYTLLSAGPSH